MLVDRAQHMPPRKNTEHNNGLKRVQTACERPGSVLAVGARHPNILVSRVQE